MDGTSLGSQRSTHFGPFALDNPWPVSPSSGALPLASNGPEPRRDPGIELWPSPWAPRGPLLWTILALLVLGAVLALVGGVTAFVVMVHSSGPAHSLVGTIPGANPAG